MSKDPPSLLELDALQNRTPELGLRFEREVTDPGGALLPEGVSDKLDKPPELDRTIMGQYSSAWAHSGENEDVFTPLEPHTFEELGISPTHLEHLVLKHLLDYPGDKGRNVATFLCVNPSLVLPLLEGLKRRMLVIHATGEASGGDFHYDLSEAGRHFAVDLRTQNPYCGPAPVPLEAYQKSVRVQSVAQENLKPADLERAFSDLHVDHSLLDQLGPAMSSGRGVFLFGNSGNGKTSLALRMARAFKSHVYIPHAVMMQGQVVQIYDPQVHRAAPKDSVLLEMDGRREDPRWVRCNRPTVVTGGELTLESLEMTANPDSGIAEAPLQVKANCGLLVIDDLGRQRVDMATLLNRWILPLESRLDYLRLPNGRKVEVPFDPLLIFSTNLDPADLVDEAFIRRIPYKVHVPDPSRTVLFDLLKAESEAMGFTPDPVAFRYILKTCYDDVGREMRYCHARDLLLQVRNRCLYMGIPLELDQESIDQAARSYFTLL
jgi:hypothetical protein